VSSCWPHLVEGGRGDVEDLPRRGRIAWLLRSRACLAEPPARVPLDQEDLGAVDGVAGAVGELAGQAQLAGAEARATSLSLRRLTAPRPARYEFEQGGGGPWAGGQPVIEGVAPARPRQPLGVGGGQALLGLPLEFRIADEDADEGSGLAITSSGVRITTALLAGQFGIGLERGSGAARQARSCVPPSGVGTVVAVGLQGSRQPRRSRQASRRWPTRPCRSRRGGSSGRRRVPG